MSVRKRNGVPDLFPQAVVHFESHLVGQREEADQTLQVAQHRRARFGDGGQRAAGHDVLSIHSPLRQEPAQTAPQRAAATAPDKSLGHFLERAAMTVEALHELLDGEQAGTISKAECRRQPHLLVQSEHVLRAACLEMQVVARPQYELAGLGQHRSVLR